MERKVYIQHRIASTTVSVTVLYAAESNGVESPKRFESLKSSYFLSIAHYYIM